VVEVDVDMGIGIEAVDEVEFEFALVDVLDGVGDLELVEDSLIEADVGVEDVDKLGLVVVDVLGDVVEQSKQSVPKSTTLRSDVLSTSAHTAKQQTTDIELQLYVEDVDKLELAFIGALERVDELELTKENAVEVDVDLEVGVGGSVEDVVKQELEVIDVLKDVVERSMQSVLKSTTSQSDKPSTSVHKAR